MNAINELDEMCSRPRLAAWGRRFTLVFLAVLTATLACAESIQITQLTTSITGTRQNLSGLVFEHDLLPATPITLTTVVAGFPAGTDPKLANVIKILEDGQVVAVLSAPSADDFANNSTNDIAYTPTTPGVKSLVVQATNGTTTVSSAAVTVYVYGIAIDRPVADTAVPLGSDLFISGPTLVRNGVVATVQFYVDGSLVGIDTSAPYAVAWRSNAVGTHSLTAMLTTSAGATVNSPTVNFAVIPAVSNGTLTVSLTSPTGGASVAAGSTVTVAAEAKLTASSGTVTQVQFYLNGAVLGSPVTSFPYTTTWKPAVAGNYVLTAIATDDKNNARASTGVVVTVTGNVPSVVLTHPANNAIVMAGGGVSLTAIPSGQDGTAASVSAVDFFVDGNLAGTATGVPFTVVWSPIQPRTTPYTITARVTASNGAQASSDPALVTVINANTPPSITLSTSNGSASVPAGKAVTLTATAADQSGSAATVASVDFFAEGILLGSSSTAPYTQTWTPLVARTEPYSLQARVNLRNGLSAFSAPVLVQVIANAAPTVTISAPIDGQTFTLGSAITLSAIAGDSDGTVAGVQFFANNAAIGSTLTAAPFQTSFTPSVTGSYTLTARVTDDTGQSVYATPVRVTIKAAVGESPSAFLIIMPESTNLLQKYFTAGSTVSIGIGASDPDGTIARVSLYYDGTKLATFDREPYATTLQLPSSADLITDHTFSVVVEDNDGNLGNAAETVGVISSSRPLPVLTLATPTEGAVFNYGTAITVEAQLTNPAVTVDGVSFIENGMFLQTVTAAPYAITYVPGSAGAKSVTAIAYYHWTYQSGTGQQVVSFGISTSAAKTVHFTVKDFSPTTDGESFVTQSYQDLLQRAATTAEVSVNGSALAAGSLTRAQLAANLVTGAGFSDSFNALAAAWIITGQWPTYANFAARVATIRGSGLAAACGELLSSIEYTANYGVTPTVASLTGTNSYANLQAFATQLYQNAYGRAPTLAEIQAVANAPSTATQAGGISVIGLNAFLAEFVAKNSSAIAARVRAAGLYIGLWRLQPTSAEVVALATKATATLAGELLADTRYAARFLAVTRPPQSLALATGASGLLAVEVSGTAPFGYQWYRNGAIVPGGTRSTLQLNKVTTAAAGNYYVVVTSTTSRVVSASATVTVGAGASRLVNLSTRGYAAGGDNVLIAGFVLGGSGAKTMLIRGVGPALVAQGVSGALADPKLTLNATTGEIGVNDDWGSGDVTAIEATAGRVGAFALTRGSRDAVLLTSLNGGVFSALATNASGSPGVAMVELYDAGAATDAVRLMNLSSRARVAAGDQAMIAGFVIQGGVSKRVLIRAVGPGLIAQGVSAALMDPQLTVTSGGVSLATNDNWSASADAALIASAASQVGAFPLVSGSLDAAVIVSLPPGVYSAVVSGTGGAEGIALVEVYDVDP